MLARQERGASVDRDHIKPGGTGMSAVATEKPGTAYARQFAETGYLIAEDVLPNIDVERLRNVIERLPAGEEVRWRRGIYGVRNLLEISVEVRALACDARIRSFVVPILGDGAFAVRGVFFD